MLLALPLSPLEIRVDDGHGAEELGVTIKELVNSTKEWDGQSLRSYPAGPPEIKVLSIKIPAGVTLPWLSPCDKCGSHSQGPFKDLYKGWGDESFWAR